jgi:hypothetical protein
VDPAALASVEGLEGERLLAVLRIWKGQRRTLSARFGGASMRPTIDPADEVAFACGEAPAVGEVAVLVSDGKLMVHRVVARSADWWLTRGDASVVPDYPLREEAVIGRVVTVARGGVPGPPGAAPASWARRAVLVVCLKALALGEAPCRSLIRLLWRGRFWLVLVPRTLARRLAGSVDEDQRSHRP